MNSTIYEQLSEKFPDVTGDLLIKRINNNVIVAGYLNSESDPKEVKAYLAELIANKYGSLGLELEVKFNSKLKIIEEDVITTTHEDINNLDEVKIIYSGMLSTRSITPDRIDKKDKDNHDSTFKIFSQSNFDKIDNAVIEMRFISPIILDSDLRIIDGNLRYDLAISNHINKVPVIVINDNGLKADLLRITLNRSSEFQRWNYDNIDKLVDSIPIAQPILEPLGFFGLKVLPESYFANTMMSYTIDPFNKQQGMYSQDMTIADWAKFREEQIPENMKERQKQKELKQKQKDEIAKGKAKLKSLFSMPEPKDEDFLETYDIDKEVEEHTQHMRTVAEKITTNYDKKRKAELEAKGKEWQNSRRGSKQVAEDNRKEIIAYIESKDISDEIKETIFERIEEFTKKDIVDDYIAKMIESDEEEVISDEE